MKIQRILVPVDGSEGSQSALAHAMDIQEGHGGEILIVMALEPIHMRVGAQVAARGTNVRMIADEQRLIAEKHLAQLESDLQARGVRARAVVASGAADEVILKTATDYSCDLIVMSTHARSGLMHLLLGSITEKVVRAATCPVLTVRGYERKSRKRSR